MRAGMQRVMQYSADRGVRRELGRMAAVLGDRYSVSWCTVHLFAVLQFVPVKTAGMEKQLRARVRRTRSASSRFWYSLWAEEFGLNGRFWVASRFWTGLL